MNFFLMILEVGAFSPPLPFLAGLLCWHFCIWAGTPQISVFWVFPCLQPFGMGSCHRYPVPWWLFQGVACAIALPELHKSLSLGETFYSCNMWKADLVWKLGREKASTCVKVWPLVV